MPVVHSRRRSKEGSRFIVCGSVNGRLQLLFSKLVKIVHQTGPVDAVFCVGNFIGEDPSEYEMCRDGRLICPTPVFFIGPTNPDHNILYPPTNGATVSTNLFYIGRRGVITTGQGTCVAYCSGTDDLGETNEVNAAPDESSQAMDEARHSLRMSDVDLIERCVRARGHNNVDILLTSAPPTGISNFRQRAAMDFDSSQCSSVVAQLALRLKPRYHFCDGKEEFFAAPPYRNYSADFKRQLQPTRLVALANALTSREAKGIYAFQMLPSSQEVSEVACAVDCPYTASFVCPLSADQIAISTTPSIPQMQFVFDPSAQRMLLTNYGTALQQLNQIGQHPAITALTAGATTGIVPQLTNIHPSIASPFGTTASYFSAAPTAAQSQLFNIGDPMTSFNQVVNGLHTLNHNPIQNRPVFQIPNVLVDQAISCDVSGQSCWFCLGEPKHENHLVISVGNMSYLGLSKGGLTDDHLMIVPFEHMANTRLASDFLLNDVDTYKDALMRYYDERTDRLPVFFERSFKTVHFQIQCVPIPKSKVDLLEEVFVEHARRLRLSIVEIDPKEHPRTSIGTQLPFFVVDLPNGKRLLVQGTDHSLHLHFGRMVLGSSRILSKPTDCIDWKTCTRTRQEEERIVAEFVRAFADYDPFHS